MNAYVCHTQGKKDIHINLLYLCIYHNNGCSRKENTVLRAKVPADHVSVIPNATDTTLFKPDISKRDKNKSSLQSYFK